MQLLSDLSVSQVCVGSSGALLSLTWSLTHRLYVIYLCSIEIPLSTQYHQPHILRYHFLPSFRPLLKYDLTREAFSDHPG